MLCRILIDMDRMTAVDASIFDGILAAAAAQAAQQHHHQDGDHPATRDGGNERRHGHVPR